MIWSPSLGIVTLPSINFQSPCLENIMRILSSQSWKLPPSNFSITFKDSIWKDDILLNINAKTNTLYYSIQMKCKWENYKLKNLLMFEDFTWNSPTQLLYVSKQNLYKKPLTLEKKICTNLKFDLKLVKLVKNSLWHTWNLKLSTAGKTSFAHISNFNIETFNNFKNSLPHTFSNFNVETFNNSKNYLPHTFSNFNVETFNNSKNSFPCTFSNFNVETLNNWRTLFHTLSQTSMLKPSTTWRTLFHTLWI